MMIKSLFVSLVLSLVPVASAFADIKEYVRDHTYHANELDNESSSRIGAIDGVKRELLDELGTYVGSVIKINQDSLGNSYMSQDMVKITAGIVALKLLNEKWKRPEFYVKASMKADPEDVLAKLKAMRADLELEKSLRASFEELQRARAEMESLRAQLAELKKAGAVVAAAPMQVAAPVSVNAPVPVSVPESSAMMKRMQKVEDQTQKVLAKSVEAEKKQPEVVLAAKPAAEDTTAQKQAQVNAEKAQQELSRDAAEKKRAAPVVAVVALPPVGAAAPVVVPAAKPDTEAAKLASSYRKAVENIEVADALQRGLAAQIGGDFTLLHKEMSALAEKSYPRAMVHMGWLYERGAGVPQNYMKALEWYEKAAAKNSGNAIAHIGRMHEMGYGMKQDYAKAVEYYKRAMDLGNSQGFAYMGYMHETGKGVQFDRVKAVAYYEKAIEMGDYDALALLGLNYQLGHGGLDRDEKKAAELYQKAIDHGIPLAMVRLGELYNQGKGGLPVDHEKALALMREGARYHLPASYAHLGRMYEEGWAVKKDYAEARKWYEQGAEHDAVFAMRRLGFMNKEGLGAPRDWDKATYWFKRAAALGDDKAEELLKKRAHWR